MRPNKIYKHLFFDMDGTVTRSKSLITPEMSKLFESIPDDIIIVSGASGGQIQKQLSNIERSVIILGQNGNQAIKDNEEIWFKKLTDDEREEIFTHIEENEKNRDWDVSDKDDLISDRICQISYSIYGHNEIVTDKLKFDPDQRRRKKLLEQNTKPLNQTEAKIGGTTTIDYIRKNANKGYNIECLIDKLGWDKDECVYFGDALYKGGNDETVVGIIDIISVDDEHDTYKKLSKMYENSSD